MGTIKTTSSNWATQATTWTSADRLATVTVYADSRRDERGAPGFSYHIGMATAPIGFGYTFAADHELIYAPMAERTDTRDVLGTLASFLAAWEEAGVDSENADLFPATCAPFADGGYCSELSCDIDGGER